MSVECMGRNVEVTPKLEELARRRTQKLERHLGGPARVRIVLSHEKHRFGAEIIASHRRRHWKAQEETDGDPRAAVTLAFEKIDAQARRDFQKLRDRKHRGAPGETIRKLPAASETPAAAAPSVPSGGTRIIRGSQQRMPAKPMSVEEAGLRLETSRQEFLIFRDSGNERISVLYRRRDGDFGLIVPEC
ncbi:MAG TPA: HPF/RaiA family ribosome-associated protein [Thermoanaerobaculia bacterium]|nr:HPF/RaiA family ribosome-associated protein [Thermoanaerobaculia bacterium]